MSEDTIANDGIRLELDGAPTVIDYNGDSTVNYIEVTQYGNTYRQSFTYSGGLVATITGWIKQ